MGFIVVSTMVALVMNLLVEAPVMNLVKAMQARLRKEEKAEEKRLVNQELELKS